MKNGWRRYDSASLMVNVPVALPSRFHAHFREITRFSVPSGDRGKGYGSELLRRVCAEADRADKRLWLTAEPYDFEDGALSGGELIELYGRHGFVPAWGDAGWPPFMARQVKVPYVSVVKA